MAKKGGKDVHVVRIQTEAGTPERVAGYSRQAERRRTRSRRVRRGL